MKPQKPVTTKENAYGGHDNLISRHPAFGMLRVGRVSGSKVLFGSEVDNTGYISIEVKQGEEIWNLHNKRYSSNGKTILNLAMSYSQFAEAITNQNCGEGVPCTLEFIQSTGHVPQISENTISVSDQIKLDIKEQSKNINDAAAELGKKIDELKLSKVQKAELTSALEKITRELNSNMPFIVSQCEEAVEHITTKSKVEIEAFAQGRIRELGMQALADKQASLIEGPKG